MIDIHSHIIPGVDDGARNFEDSVQIVRWLASQGVTDVIATPHYVYETDYVSPRAQNLQLLEGLKDRLVDEGVDVKVYLGNEIYIDRDIARLIRAGEMSTMADSEYLLVELPLNDEYSDWEDILIDLMNRGYQVILAHPERYEIVQKDYEIVKRLHEAGILLQCNLASLVGRYGKRAQKIIRKIAKDKMIFALGSDVHRRGRSDYLVLAQKKLARYYDARELNQLLVVNPSKILME